MNKFTFPLLIVITTICIYQFSKNKQNIKYINYMNEIIESKNLMINNLLKDDLYDINRDLYSYIYNIDSSLLENNQKTTLCIYISAEKHCDACIEFELKYIRKNALENNIIIITTPLNTRIFIYILLTDNFPLVTYTFTLILLNYITIPSSTQALILLNFNCCI